MKATGIVRRLDELGRIVIPKELRRTLHLREGDPLEIFTQDEEEIILKKYSSLKELSVLAGDYCSVLARSTAQPVIICNRLRTVAAAGLGPEYTDLPLDQSVQRVMQANRVYLAPAGEQEPLFIVPVGEQPGRVQLRLAVPIAVNTQVEGCILLVSGAQNDGRTVQPVTETERKLAVLAAELLAKQLQI